MIKKFSKKLKMALITSALMALSVVSAFADVTTPTSMLDADVTALIQDFAADIVPTVVALLAILIPTGLILWGIGFAVKKGLAFIQKKAKQAV